MKKEIRDSEGILKVVAALFGKLPVSVHIDGKEVPIRIIALKNKSLVVSTDLSFPNTERILTTVHNGQKFITHFRLATGDGNGIEVLVPVRMLIVEAKRAGNRIESISGSSGALVTNIINITDITKAIGFDDKKVDSVLTVYKAKLSKVFPVSTIFFAGRMDNRLRLMQHYDKDIFIPNRLEKSSASPNFFPFDEYLRIFENSKIPDTYVSEISIPIRYKGYIHLGYVQVLSEKSLEFAIYEHLQMFSQAVGKDIVKTGVFQESKDVCPVIDISSGGISFLHAPSRSFSRSVTMNATLIFDLQLSSEVNLAIRGVIKNIRNQETNFRVGCQFYNLTENNRETLTSFLEEKEEKQNPKMDTPSTKVEAEEGLDFPEEEFPSKLE